MPAKKPSIVTVPKNELHCGNDENGEYKDSIGLLYAIAFTIKMSYKGSHIIDGYFEYTDLILFRLYACPISYTLYAGYSS